MTINKILTADALDAVCYVHSGFTDAYLNSLRRPAINPNLAGLEINKKKTSWDKAKLHEEVEVKEEIWRYDDRGKPIERVFIIDGRQDMQIHRWYYPGEYIEVIEMFDEDVDRVSIVYDEYGWLQIVSSKYSTVSMYTYDSDRLVQISQGRRTIGDIARSIYFEYTDDDHWKVYRDTLYDGVRLLAGCRTISAERVELDFYTNGQVDSTRIFHYQNGMLVKLEFTKRTYPGEFTYKHENGLLREFSSVTPGIYSSKTTYNSYGLEESAISYDKNGEIDAKYLYEYTYKKIS